MGLEEEKKAFKCPEMPGFTALADTIKRTLKDRFKGSHKGRDFRQEAVPEAGVLREHGMPGELVLTAGA